LEILLEDIGRRFNQEWVFKKINYRFVQGQSYAILGPNGSGKSTLLQVLAGSLSPSKGKITYYSHQEKIIDVEKIYTHLALTAPYLELIEEFTLLELLNFHFKFKTIANGWDIHKLLQLLQLEKSANKEIRYFSSGMKQRVKLVLTCCTDSPLLMLDEPTSNLDNQGVEWYLELIKTFASNKLLLICSNQTHEHDFCDHRFNILDYK
jgi:ABC-type multidrug transport system ATPase subunit